MKLPLAIAALSALAFLCAEISAAGKWKGVDGWGHWEDDGAFDPPKLPDKTSWPELVRQSGEDAKAQILKEWPDAQVEILNEHSGASLDYNTGRVRIVVNDDGIVTYTPTIG